MCRVREIRPLIRLILAHSSSATQDWIEKHSEEHDTTMLHMLTLMGFVESHVFFSLKLMDLSHESPIHWSMGRSIEPQLGDLPRRRDTR